MTNASAIGNNEICTGNKTNTSHSGQYDNETTTNMNVKIYFSVVRKENVSSYCSLLGESYAELAPVCVRAEETVVSKFVRNVHQFVNMRNLVVKKVKQ